MSDEIYNNFPEIRSYSLLDFVDFASDLYADLAEQGGDHDGFLKFVLTGDVLGDHQAVVDPFRNSMEPGHGIEVLRDYDSIIGVSDHVVATCILELNPVSNQTDSLTKSIHLEHEIMDGEVSPCPSG
jgi:hypothetical protein